MLYFSEIRFKTVQKRNAKYQNDDRSIIKHD